MVEEATTRPPETGAPTAEQQREAAEYFETARRQGLITVEDGVIKPASESKNIKILTAADIQKKQAEWLVPEYIPRNSITTIAGDGGVGKTSIWCNLVASVSTGKPPFLLGEREGYDGDPSEPADVLVLSAEDSWEYQLIERLQNNGADMTRVHFVPTSDPQFTDLTFDSELLQHTILSCKPTLVVFDPLQAFVGKGAKMAERNTMRKCMTPLIGMGELYGITTIIIAHANKQSCAWGRKRIADSADIWDASRSVLMVGNATEKGIRYISHEKSNYGPLGETVLFTIADTVPVFKETTDRRDREFVMSEMRQKNEYSASADAKDFIINTLTDNDGEMIIGDLDDMAKAFGISKNSMRNAKTDLKNEGKVKSHSTGYGKEKKHYISLTGFEKTNK